jgi:hypothetical protein
LQATIELGGEHGLPSGKKLNIFDKKKETLRLAEAKKGLMRPVVARKAEEVPTTQPGEINDVHSLDNEEGHIEEGHIKKKPGVEVHEWPINLTLTTEQKSQLVEGSDEFRDGFAFDTSELGVMECETIR